MIPLLVKPRRRRSGIAGAGLSLYARVIDLYVYYTLYSMPVSKPIRIGLVIGLADIGHSKERDQRIVRVRLL